MHAIRRHLRSSAWLALVVALALALLPSVTRALTSGEARSSICSVGDDATGTAPGDDSGAPPHAAHCPLCSSVWHTPLLPPAESLRVAVLDGADDVAAVFEHVPRPRHAWDDAQARGPPMSV